MNGFWMSLMLLVLYFVCLEQTKGTYDRSNFWDKLREKYSQKKRDDDDSHYRNKFGHDSDSSNYRNRYSHSHSYGSSVKSWWEKLKKQSQDKDRSQEQKRDFYEKKDPRDIKWSDMKQNDWNPWWSKLTVWKKSVEKSKYSSHAAACGEGKVLQCWSCQNENEEDCRPNQHGNKWQTCAEGESCYTEYKKILVRQSYMKQIWVTKVSRGCMKLSTCKLKQCRDCWSKNNCRDCGGRCWSRCEHPKCPQPVKCRRCDNVKCKEDCYAKNNYETCYQDDAVCIEQWSCVKGIGATYSSGCSNRVDCYRKKDASDSYNKIGLVDCKEPKCPSEPKPTTVKPTTQRPTTVKPTTQRPTTEKPTTEKPTTKLPCPGPGEDTIDFKDKNNLKLTITGPETVEKRNPMGFLLGFKKSKPLFLVMQGDKENEVLMEFINDMTYNIVRMDFETSKADWVQAQLFNGKTLQHTLKAYPADPSAKWSPSSVNVGEEEGKGITKIVFSFGFQTGELKARGSFLTVCP